MSERALAVCVRLLAAAMVLPLVGACSVNPATGERQIALMSEAQEIEMGRQAERCSLVGTHRLEEAVAVEKAAIERGDLRLRGENQSTVQEYVGCAWRTTHVRLPWRAPPGRRRGGCTRWRAGRLRP